MGTLTAGSLLLSVLLLPTLAFGWLALAWLLDALPGERTIVRVSAAVSLAMCGGIAALWGLVARGTPWPIAMALGDALRLPDVTFPIALVADGISLPMMTLAVALTGVIGHFSGTYLHRERGFVRFFLLLHLFAATTLLVLAAGSLDLLIVGWELVGITSVLLVAFFHERPAPVQGAARIFAVYRVTDLGIILAAFLLHHWVAVGAGDATPPQGWRLSLVALLLLFSAAGKSAQVPFSGWLPRAMEGPTPSSAIFYGAIAVHLGPYLLIRHHGLMAGSPAATATAIGIGALTALHGTLAGRAAADAKTSLAHATLTQVGLIFIEVGLGLHTLALWHIAAHALVRTQQFLRAPSMLHDFHQMHAATGGHLHPTGRHFHQWLPEPVRILAYRFALDRSHLDTLLDRGLAEPLVALSRRLGRLDTALLGTGPATTDRARRATTNARAGDAGGAEGELA